MSKVDFELNRAGVAELLNGAEMAGIIRESTERVLQAAQEDTDGYEMEVGPTKDRVSGIVWADSLHAKNSNREKSTLLKALRRGKL